MERCWFVPLNPTRIIRQPHPKEATPPPSSQISSQTPVLLTSSPLDAMILRSSNVSLNSIIANTPLESPITTHIRRLTGVAEQLQAETAILTRQNAFNLIDETISVILFWNVY